MKKILGYVIIRIPIYICIIDSIFYILIKKKIYKKKYIYIYIYIYI